MKFRRSHYAIIGAAIVGFLLAVFSIVPLFPILPMTLFLATSVLVLSVVSVVFTVLESRQDAQAEQGAFQFVYSRTPEGRILANLRQWWNG